MADLTFTLRGRDELSRVLDGTADSADRLRLRMAGVTADADGTLRDLQGRFITTEEAQRRLREGTTSTSRSFGSLSDAADKLGERLKASLISLAPAAIPATAALAEAAGAVGVQLGAAALAAAAYTVALKPQLAEVSAAVQAQDAYEEAVRTSGAASQEAVQAQAAYQQQLDKMPPATRRASIAVGLLKDDFQDWSDSLSGDVMGPFNKGIAVADALLPKTSGLVRGASTEFDRLITMVGGEITTPGFDKLTGDVTDFADKTLDHAIDELRTFLATADTDKVGEEFEKFLAYARANGPAVWSTLQNIGDALLNVLQAGSDIGVSMLDVINLLSGIVAAVPPDAIATVLQMAIAIKALRLAAAGIDVGRIAIAAFSAQVTGMTTAARAAPGALAGTRAAIGSLSTTAKIAIAGAGLGLLLTGLTLLGRNSRDSKPDVDKMTTSLGTLGDTGHASGEVLRVFDSDLGGLAKSVDRLSGKASGMDKFNDVMNKVFTLGMKKSNSFNDAKDDIDALDKSLANLVNSDKAGLAAAALNSLTKNLKPEQVKELRTQLDGYSDALAGQALEEKLAAESMGLFGVQAQETQKQLDAQKQSADGLRQSIQALNDVNRQALGGQIAFEAAIDASAKAAKTDAGVLRMRNGELVLTTDKQRDAATALSDLAAKTDAATASARDSGKSWAEISDIYERGRQQLVKNAIQMGLTRSQAKSLADQILKTPDKTAYLKGDLSDLQAKLADAKARLKKAPSSKTASIKGEIKDLEKKIAAAKAELKSVHDKTVNLTIRTGHVNADHTYTSSTGFTYAHGGLIGRAGGGPIPGFPGGGLLHGPGTPTSDDILMWGSRGEYMMRAAAVDKYGLKFMEAVNTGRLPLGKAATAGLPAAPVASAASAGGDRPSVTYNVYPRASVIDAADLRLIQRQEEARQRVGRPR